MTVKLLTEQQFEFLSLTGDCTGSSESKLESKLCPLLTLRAFILLILVVLFFHCLLLLLLCGRVLCLILACADPESFVRGVQLFLVDEGREYPNTTKSGH